jgi:hypothetical protein
MQQRDCEIVACRQNYRGNCGHKNRLRRHFSGAWRVSRRSFRLCTLRPLSRWRLLLLDRFSQLLIALEFCDPFFLRDTHFEISHY